MPHADLCVTCHNAPDVRCEDCSAGHARLRADLYAASVYPFGDVSDYCATCGAYQAGMVATHAAQGCSANPARPLCDDHAPDVRCADCAPGVGGRYRFHYCGGLAAAIVHDGRTVVVVGTEATRTRSAPTVYLVRPVAGGEAFRAYGDELTPAP